MKEAILIEESQLFGPTILRALEFAALAHDGQRRRGGARVPYFAHPAAVGLILARFGFSQQVVAAGVLHDVIEDTPVTAEEMAVHFGPEITRLVLGVSENKSLPHAERKALYVEQIRTADSEVKAISSADKIANLTNLIVLLEEGEDVFASVYKHNTREAMFAQAQAEHDAVASNFNHPIVAEHKTVLDTFMRKVQVK